MTGTVSYQRHSFPCKRGHHDLPWGAVNSGPRCIRVNRVPAQIIGERIGKELIVRNGKGSRLTPFAENLMKQYRRMQSVVRAETDEV